MESHLSCLSSLKEEDNPVYVQPHYKESYRLAIYALLCGGKEAYEDFLQAEHISNFLSEDEILFILENAKASAVAEEDEPDGRRVPDELSPSTYFPMESDEEVPNLDLGWPDDTPDDQDTSISLLFHPPRQNTPTIKEVVRKQIQEAKQVIAIAMDIFTDVDIFKEIIGATLRGVAVYILLDESQYKSFHTMSQRVGVNIQDLKNIRVRTVQGQQYRCQSGMKFRGGLGQKFILVDCQTVLYGTYSYTWSYEKINLSMVLVITGQLVCSYDEEFRRLYARSAVPPFLSKERLSVQDLRDAAALHSPNSSQLSLHPIHMRSRLHGLRICQDDRINSAAVLTKGMSMQDRLHQSHYPEMGTLVRGHSYGEELQKLNTMTRLRMGTKDIGAPGRTGSKLRGGVDLSNRLSQQRTKQRTHYGPDQNLIPFNSETSLHRWKIDTYLNTDDALLNASCEAITPIVSPYSSHTGLNDLQSQMIHNRSRDIKSRLEELRQRRHSLQEYANLRHSQECLRSMYPTPERPKFMSSLRGLDIRHSTADLDPNMQDGCSLQPANHEHAEPKREDENIPPDGNRSASYYDIKTGPDRMTVPAQDWQEPPVRTTSTAELNVKLNESPLKLSHCGLQHQRMMESLTEIPEEREGSNPRINSSETAAGKERCEDTPKDEKGAPTVNSGTPAESRHQGVAKGHQASAGNEVKTAGSRRKSTSDESETIPKIFNSSASSETKSIQTEKQREEPNLQRRNSLRQKVCPVDTSDEKKASKKEEKPLQRKASFKSQTSSGSTQRADSRASPAEKPSAAEQTTKKSLSQSFSRSRNSLNGPLDAEKPRSPFALPRSSSQRSSKRKTNLAAEQERGSTSTLENQDTVTHRPKKDKAYSRFEYLLATDNVAVDKTGRTSGLRRSDKHRNSPMSKHDSGHPANNTQSGADKKLGRFMQRVGNLIGKNK